MTISADHIRKVIDRYLTIYPDEDSGLSPLLMALAERPDTLASRRDTIGHVTCGVAASRSDGRVLSIRHRALDRWLLPGGHLEESDFSLEGAAVRELTEEVGIPGRDLSGIGGLGGVPIDIDIHLIPANPANHEPAHEHYDFRFAFVVSSSAISLQEEEVTSFEWVFPAELHSESLRRKLSCLVEVA